MKFILLPIAMMLIAGSLYAQSTSLTARQHFATIDAQVTANHAPDVRLFMAMAMYSFAGYPMDLNFESGTAELWLYGYLSASEQSIITAVATESPLLGTMIGEVASDTWPEGADSLYTVITSYSIHYTKLYELLADMDARYESTLKQQRLALLENEQQMNRMRIENQQEELLRRAAEKRDNSRRIMLLSYNFV